jgi:gliding motility-associated-like protein
MKAKFLLLNTFFLVCSLSSFGQYPGNIWYFGQNAGLDFTTQPPTVLTDGMVNSIEGSATMSDLNGNLLFYTDGVTVWDKNHEIMENGEGLFGNPTTTQGALILKQPGVNQFFYIFTCSEFASVNGFCYSIVDLSQNGGLGKVTEKNHQLLTPVAEKLTVVKHANNEDYWIIVHKYNSDAFYSYLLTAAGVGVNPVISNTGTVQQGGTYGTYNSVGYLKPSPSGEKLALAVYEIGIFELFDFNKSNGAILHQLTFDDYQRCYGVEFSPNNHLLYVKEVYSGKIFQYNLEAGSPGGILNSKTLIGTATNTPTPVNYISGGMQLGKDGKIYVAKYMDDYLGSIESPDIIGAACNFVDDAVYLNGKKGQLGFPYAGEASQISILSENFCFGDSTSFSIQGLAQIYITLWNFGDPASGTQNTSTLLNPFHKFSAPGTYNVSLTVISFGNTTILTKEIIIHPTPEITLGNDTLICNGNPLLLAPGAGFENYLWQDNSIQPTFTVNQSGLYWVEVGNEFGCTSRDSIEVTISEGPEIFLGNDSTLCVGDTVLLNPGSNFQNYLWQDGSTNSTFTATNGGVYWVEVSDEFGCPGYDTINLTFLPGPEVFLGNDTLVCFDETVILDAGSGYENYLWQDGSAGQTNLISQPGTYWVQVSNACGNGIDTINISFSEPFDISLGSDTSFCYGQNILLDAGAGFSEYLWQNGAITQTVSANFTGNYWVEVTDSLGCTATDTVFIETFMDFNISIGDDTVTICKGDYVFLNGPGGYQNYLWQDGSDFTSLLADTAGTYWLEVTDENGCSARDSMQLLVNEIPSRLLENDTVICPETALTLHALPGYKTYLWQDGSADSFFVTDHPGKFWVTVQDEFGCSGTDSIIVSPFQIPDLGVEQQEIICRGDSLVLSPGANYQSYLWQDGSENPEFLVTEEGNYWVEMATNCGFYSDSVKVVFYEGNLDLGRDTTLCDGEFLSLNPGNGYSRHLWSNGSTESNILVSESGIYWLKAFDGFCFLSDSIEVDVCASLWFPNVFTPNSDGTNDVFYAVATNPEGITAFKMTIFNRWGRIVHEMGHVNEVWDGKINGSNGSAGSYFWVCDFAARDKTGNLKNYSRQGSVTLFR